MTRSRSKAGFLIAMFVLSTLGAPWASSQPAASDGTDRGLASLDEAQVWADPLDDLSHIYNPSAGLVGVEVSGGDAHLKAGSSDGWFASEVIRCPPGHGYDLVYLEVDTPGDSSVEVSILDPTADSTEIGFANRTIDGYKLRQETDLDISDVDPEDYPEVRIQANLHSSGFDRPRVLSWALYFLGPDHWRDDFIGPGRMSQHRGLNLTDGDLEIDLGGRRSNVAGRSGDPFPTIAISDPAANAVHLFMSNVDGTSYGARQSMTGLNTTRSVVFEDMNGDGIQDMIVGATSLHIRWGVGNGTWPETGQTVLNPTTNFVTTADFNGDGEMDIGASWGTTPGMIFLNQGSGVFNVVPDINLTGYASWGCSSGDLDVDGYDDFVLGRHIFLGGPNGPSTTPNITLGTTNNGFFSIVTDLNGDGHLDVLLANNEGGSAQIWLGGEDGPDVTVDYALATTRTSYRVATGDLNGDGYEEVIYSMPGTRIEFFEGTETGWYTSGKHHLANTPNVNYGFSVHDVNKDGYADVMVVDDTTFDIYLGGTSWPTSPDISKACNAWTYNIAVAEKQGPPVFWGTFTSRPIDLPSDRKWDMLNLEGSLPENSTMRLSVLDRSGGEIAGYTDLTDLNVDLSDLDRTLHPTIQVKITITSQVGSPDPVLHRLTVKWLDLWVWRDEFYGEVRIDRLSYLGVSDGHLRATYLAATGPQLIFPSIRGDSGYTTTPKAFFDAGGLDYGAEEPFDYRSKGTSAVDTADINGDGYNDVAFAVYSTADNIFSGKSPLFLGSPVGSRQVPSHTFDTTGASDVMLRDLNDDGYTDVVFAQERRSNNDYMINSTLFWGSVDGWADSPDVVLTTRGAAGVEAVDVNDDGRLDLVFACFKGASTATDSMVFLQDENGYCGTTPSHLLPTKGARAVASGDLDGDGRMDLVFANSIMGSSVEIDSSIYWGKTRGGFEVTPTGLPTSGAADVKVADLDGDTDLDIVFANHWNDSIGYDINSYVYLNRGSGVFGTVPAAFVPTVGATGVTVADMDGTGWMDLVFSCQDSGSTYDVASVAYLGGASGWGTSPNIELPTVGATDVVAARLLPTGSAGYMSETIAVEDARDTGTFHTFRYNATVGTSIQGVIQLVDADTWEVLVETRMTSGSHQWDIKDLFLVRDHPSVRVIAIVSGLAGGGTFTLDDLWLNWTKRVRKPPRVVNLDLTAPFVYRLGSVGLHVNVTDDYDLSKHLDVTVQHRPNGTDEWESHLTPTLTYNGTSGTWVTRLLPMSIAALGSYDLRASARDLDGQSSGWVEFPNALEIRNNLPTAPVVRMTSEEAVTTSTLAVVIDERSTDVETSGLIYVYRWYRDGILVGNATTDQLLAHLTSKGEVWSVEVTAFDGDEEGPPGTAWVVIGNAPPIPAADLPDPELEEDTTDDRWLNLSKAFDDPDGDVLTWSVTGTLDNLTINIDDITGMVTIVPAPNWHGAQEVTFTASDGEMTASQLVTIYVTSINDIPTIDTVDGLPVVTDSLEYTTNQGEVLVIHYTVEDLDGDEVLAHVTTLAVVHDKVARTITYSPGIDDLGTLTFTLIINDVVSVSDQVTLEFVITVEDENDPMTDLSITNPAPGTTFEVNASFTLEADCDDPDIPLGQVLNYTWESNISGVLGYGPSLTISLDRPGIHKISVTVRDPDFAESASITVVIEPEEQTEPPLPPDSDGDPQDTNWGLVAVVIIVIVIVGAIAVILKGKGRTGVLEDLAVDEESTALLRSNDTSEGPSDEWVADDDEWVETFEEV